MDATVEAFTFGVSDGVAKVCEEIIQVTIQGFGYINDRLQAAVCRPAVPFAEELFGILRVRVVPKPTEMFFDGPGSRRFQLQVLQFGKTQRLRFTEVLWIEKPKLFRAGQRRRVVLSAPRFGPAPAISGLPAAFVGCHG